MSFTPPDPRYTRPVYNDRPSRFSLFWLRQKKMIRRISVSIIFIVVVGICGWVGIHMLSDQSISIVRSRLEELNPLQIRHIIIHGRHLTDEEDILACLGTRINHSLFSFSVENARINIDSLPFVRHSTVERHLPDTIIITITELSPIALWQTQGRFVLINNLGERISEQNISEKDNKVFHKLPLVVGDGANTEAPNIIDVLSRYPAIKDRTLALIRIGERRWNILLRNGTILLLPEGAEESSLKRLTDYQKQFRLLERPIISIDMRLADRMIIHPAPPEKESLSSEKPPSSQMSHSSSSTGSPPP